MKIYSCKYLKKFNGLSLAPLGIFIRPDRLTDKTLIHHEKIHWEQQKEMGFLPFYIWYGLEWMWKGYRKISFEREAYENDHNPDYLTQRKPWDWMKYI